MATNNGVLSDYWFNHLSVSEQLNFENWMAAIHANMPPLPTRRDFYCGECGWRGKLDDAKLRDVEPCPQCGTAMADVEVPEEF